MRAFALGLLAAGSVALALGLAPTSAPRPVCVTVDWTRDPQALQVLGHFTRDSVPASLSRSSTRVPAAMVDISPAVARGLAVTSLAGYDSAHIERLIHLSGSGRVFLVPYAVDDDCTRHPDLEDPKREYPGMFFAAIRLRPPAEWLSEIPTADFGPFEVSYQEAQHPLMLKWRPETLPSLTLEQVAVVYRALPTRGMLACSYGTALDSLRALIRQHPDWAARRPVREILSWWGWRPPPSWEENHAPCPDTSSTKRPN